MHFSFFFSLIEMYSANTTKKLPVVWAGKITVFHYFHILEDILYIAPLGCALKGWIHTKSMVETMHGAHLATPQLTML